MVGLIKTIFIIVVVWYTFKLIGKFLMPWLLKKGMAKVQNNMESKFRQAAEQSRPQRPDGNISVDDEGNSSRKINTDNVGEYVEFEEVD